MKKTFIASTLFFSAIFFAVGGISTSARATICPGTCVNVNPNSQFATTCQYAGQISGQAGCNQQANVGCVWQQMVGFCQNVDPTSQFATTCQYAGQIGGQTGCNQQANVG